MVVGLEKVADAEVVKLFNYLNMWSPHVSSTLVIGDETM